MLPIIARSRAVSSVGGNRDSSKRHQPGVSKSCAVYEERSLEVLCLAKTRSGVST